MELTITKVKIDSSMIGGDAFIVVENHDGNLKKIDCGALCICYIKQIPHGKMRSHEQLSLYHVGCRFIASISDDTNFNTQKKVDEQTKISCRLVESYFYYENKKTGEKTLNLVTGSVGYSNLDHLDACEFFNNAFDFQAGLYNHIYQKNIDREKYVAILKLYIQNNYMEARGL